MICPVLPSLLVKFAVPRLVMLQMCLLQVVDELFSYWTLEDSEDTLEQLEELLIVSPLLQK